jgi:hypothetical protein
MYILNIRWESSRRLVALWIVVVLNEYYLEDWYIGILNVARIENS